MCVGAFTGDFGHFCDSVGVCGGFSRTTKTPTHTHTVPKVPTLSQKCVQEWPRVCVEVFLGHCGHFWDSVGVIRKDGF